MGYKRYNTTEVEVLEGCGHNPPRKFDTFLEAHQYAVKVSKQPHYLGGTTPVQLIVREVRGSVRTYKNGEF